MANTKPHSELEKKNRENVLVMRCFDIFHEKIKVGNNRENATVLCCLALNNFHFTEKSRFEKIVKLQLFRTVGFLTALVS